MWRIAGAGCAGSSAHGSTGSVREARPACPAVAKAYQDAGLLLLQGYGLTESAPVICFNHKNAYKLETVGRPIPGVEVKIADDGEVLTRGPHVMKGYWKNPQATADAIRAGWLHTGDLGRLDADGFLTITGRKKELLVLSSGKKVVPTHIEGLLSSDPCIDQAVLHGEGKNFLTALIVPNWPNLCAALAACGIHEISDASRPRPPSSGVRVCGAAHRQGTGGSIALGTREEIRDPVRAVQHRGR